MKTSDFFLSINEPFAAGLFEFPEDVPIPRYAVASFLPLPGGDFGCYGAPGKLPLLGGKNRRLQ